MFREEVGWSCSMVREDHVSAKSLKHGRVTVKCAVVDRLDSMPLNKSRGKGKRRVKKTSSDIPNGHLLYDWRVNKPFFRKPSLPSSRKVLLPDLKRVADTDWAADNDEIEDNGSDDGIMESAGWALSLSLLLDTAKKHIQDTMDARSALQKAEVDPSDFQKCEELDASHSEALDFQRNGELSAAHLEDTDSDNTDAEIPDMESFRKELEVFKSEVEAASSPRSVAESDNSWSSIELSDAEESYLGDWEDDWSIVEDEFAV